MGGSDCGLFAVAFATIICHGFDPSLCVYDQEKMREHLKISFEMEVLNPFPPFSKPRPGLQAFKGYSNQYHPSVLSVPSTLGKRRKV